MKNKLLIPGAAISLLILTILVWFVAYRPASDTKHASEVDQNRMRSIVRGIDYAAITEPGVFVAVFKNGVATNITALPASILALFPFSTNDVTYSIDHWGRPFNVSVMPAENQSNGQEFRVSVWSVGPNGADEGGVGDDIALRAVSVMVSGSH